VFRTAFRSTGRLAANPMTGVDMCRMVKRRLNGSCLPTRLSPHFFRVFTVTDLFNQGVPLEDVQSPAGHGDPSTARPYDRRHEAGTRNLVERIALQVPESTR
jgi:site-specific recombinase XerD